MAIVVALIMTIAVNAWLFWYLNKITKELSDEDS